MGLRFGHGKIGSETLRSRNDARRSKRTCRSMDAITRPCEHFSESPSTSRAGSVRSNGREKPSPRTVGRPVCHRARAGASLEIQTRQTRNNLVCPHRDGDDPSHKVEDVGRVVVFDSPVIGVIDDPRVFVRLDLIAVNDPIQC